MVPLVAAVHCHPKEVYSVNFVLGATYYKLEVAIKNHFILA